MADRIKGITVEIGGDTTGLSNALREVNNRSRDLQKELKDVERLLKFDPNNVELVAQRQQLLTQSIEATTQKLNQLKEAEQQVQRQFEQGEIGEEQYRAFRREIQATEQSLQHYEQSLADIQGEQERVSQGTRELNTIFEATESSVEDYADVIGQRLVRAIQNGTATSRDLEYAFRRIGTQVVGANGDLERFQTAIRSVDDGNSLPNVRREISQIQAEAEQAEGSVNELGGELTNLAAGLAAGGGISSVIEQALNTSALNTKIDISFDVPEESKQTVKAAVKSIETYGIDAESALEGVRRQWALNKDATKESNDMIVRGAAAVATAFSGIDFTELIQETNEVAASLQSSNEEALSLINALLKTGFPPEQLDTVAEYGAQMKNAGYSLQEIQSIFEAGIDTKSWNIDNLNDGVKEARIRMAEFGEAVPEAMSDVLEGTTKSAQDMMAWGKAVAEGGTNGAKAMSEMVKWLDGIEDKSKKNAIATQIFGTMWEDQGQNMISVFKGVGNAVDRTTDNTKILQSTISKLNNDPAIKMQHAFADMKKALEPLLVSVANFVSKIANWISENPKLAATVAAVATAVGILVGVCMGLAPILYSLATATGLLGVGVGAMVAPLAAAALGIGGMVTAGVGLVKFFKDDAMPEIDRFGEGVSESTKQALGGFFKLSDEGSLKIRELSITSQTVTTEMKDALLKIYGDMNVQILTKMDERHAQELEKLNQFFLDSAALTQAEEDKILQDKIRHNDDEKKLAEDKEARIKEILEKASSEKRALTESEQLEINNLQAVMNQNAVKYLSVNEVESKAILERMKQTAGTLTTEQAAEVVRNSNKQKEEAIKAANEQYNGTIKEIIKMRDESKIISADQADKLIRDATRQRDEVVHRAEDMHKDVVSAAEKQATEHAELVNWETGEIKSQWEVLKGYLKKTDLKTIGSDVIRGFIIGLETAAQSLPGVVGGIAKMVTGGLKKALDINSPSRVTMELGEFTGEGLAIGLENSLGQIRTMADRMATAATPKIAVQSLNTMATTKSGPIINVYPQKAIIDDQDILRTFQRGMILYE